MNPTVRRRLAAVAVPLLLLASACSGEDDGQSTTPQPSSEQSGSPEAGDGELAQEQLQAALLTAEDLPPGYTQGTVSADEDGPTGSDETDCAARFQALDEFEDTAVATAEAQFQGSEVGTVLGQKLSSFSSEAQVSDRIGQVAAVLMECPSFTSTDEAGVMSTATLSPLAFPELGDEMLAFSVALERPGLSAAVDVVAIRVGTSLQLLTQGGLATDVAALEQAARAGTEKLQALE